MPESELRSGDDVEAILKIALRNELKTDNDLRRRLTQSAEELGISPEALASAERQYLVEQRIEEYMRVQRKEMRTQVAAFVGGNLLMHVIWALVMFGQFYWPGIVLACWTFALIVEYIQTMQRPEPEDPRFRAWLEKRPDRGYTSLGNE